MPTPHPTCMTKKIEDTIRIPRIWLEEIAKEDKEEYLFINDCGNILRAKKVTLYKYSYSPSEGDDIPHFCIDFEYNPDDLVPEMEDGKLVIKKR